MPADKTNCGQTSIHISQMDASIFYLHDILHVNNARQERINVLKNDGIVIVVIILVVVILVDVKQFN